jgi:translation elongation factor EF-Ts
LRKKGALKAATKAGRVAGEGLVTVSVSPNHSLGLLFEVHITKSLCTELNVDEL